jgi:class 3 adenylate cyclase
MAETRKLAAILAADVAGYSKLAGSDEERTLARLRALRSDLFDPTIALHHGRVDLGVTQLKNIAEPVHVYSLQVGKPALAKPSKSTTPKQLSTLLGAGVLAVMIATGL